MKMSSLAGDYYAACNAVFRRSTNQSHLMLKEVREFCRDKESMSILSVGSGVGLFEIPMLKMLIEDRIDILKFVGIDINEYACNVFKEKLQAGFGRSLEFDVVHQSFQEFASEARLSLILYNHVLEYLGDHHLKWIHKSLDLLSDNGNILIFSPDRSGINKIYDETMKDLNGFDPFFSDDVETMLTGNFIEFSTKRILAECDISLLDESNDNPGKIKLLGFLTQIDCRRMSDERKNEYARYYKSLRGKNKNTIPHPATLFIL